MLHPKAVLTQAGLFQSVDPLKLSYSRDRKFFPSVSILPDIISSPFAGEDAKEIHSS